MEYRYKKERKNWKSRRRRGLEEKARMDKENEKR